MNEPRLRFTPHAFAKLLIMRDSVETEIGGLGVIDLNDPLRVTDILIPKQEVTAATVEFDDDGLADLIDEQLSAGRQMPQFMRVWIHTHPGNCPEPSPQDEETFAQVLGACDWSIMYILAKGGREYTRLQYGGSVPGGQFEIDAIVDWYAPFQAGDPDAWRDQIAACVYEPPPVVTKHHQVQQQKARKRIAPQATASTEDLFDRLDGDELTEMYYEALQDRDEQMSEALEQEAQRRGFEVNELIWGGLMNEPAPEGPIDRARQLHEEQDDPQLIP